MKKKDIKAGDKYFRWTILKEVKPKGNNRYFLAKCNCGKEKEVFLYNILNGRSMSCGCIKKDNWYIVHKHSIKHNMSHTHIYGVYSGMKSRCYNKNTPRYKNYGKRGIGICKDWLSSFENFYKDMNSTYKKGLSIERINNDLGYSKENCTWATAKQQANNRTNNIKKKEG